MARVGVACAFAVLIVAGSIPAVAAAAQPATGEVGSAATRVDWTGEVSGPSVATDLPYAASGGTRGTCTAPLCDTFRLTVRGADGAPLRVSAEVTSVASNLSLEVVSPDGSAAFEGSLSASTAKTITIPATSDGEYAVHVSAGHIGAATEITYEASALVGGAQIAADCVASRRFQYETGGAPLSGRPADDPLYDSMFGHPQMNLAGAWARGGRGQGVTIAVLDTGIDLEHPDLAANLVPGVDLREGEEGDCAAGPRDAHGHGTHVAGLSAAVAGNGIGVAGVAPRAKIMPVRVCDANGSCPTAAIVEGIRWAAEHGADVVNLSISGDEITQRGLVGPGDEQEAVDHARALGAVVVAAAGNSSWAFCGYPAAITGILCVGAVDKRGVPTTYSNFPADRDAQIEAVRAFGGGDLPGCDEQAVSTWWPGAGENPCGQAYGGLIGTSMAAPHVAGVVAVMRSFGIAPGEVIDRMLATASGGGRYDPVMGYGIPDVDAATAGLTAIEPPPAAAASAPAAPPPAVAPARPAAAPPALSRACRRARAAVRTHTRRLARARKAGKRALARRETRRRAAARRAVRRHCR